MIDVRKLEADSGLQSRVIRRGKEVAVDVERETVSADGHICSTCGAKSQRRAWKDGVCKSCRKPAGWAKPSSAPEKTGGGTRAVKRTPKKAAAKLSGGPVDLIGLLSGERARLAARIEAIDRAMEALSE